MRTFNVSLVLRTTAVGLLSTLFFGACTSDTELSPPALDAVPSEVVQQFKELGFDVSDIRYAPTGGELDGLPGKRNYLLEGDIVITPENLEQMLASDLHHVGPMGEQYRTNNLVSSPRTIRVIGYTGGSQALTTKMRTALQWAVDNYNALGNGLTFTLTFGTAYSSYDIVVYKTTGSAGGSAGFPSGGAPYKWVQIYSGTDSYDTNVIEHVITHEIGHCVGMRHTDYFDRSLSCGTGGNEGSGSDGAVHIPGTPTGFDATSIMLSCFSSSEDGEFGAYDITALNYLY